LAIENVKKSLDIFSKNFSFDEKNIEKFDLVKEIYSCEEILGNLYLHSEDF